MAFTIKANGAAHRVDGDTPLLWVLRDVLGMTGTLPHRCDQEVILGGVDHLQESIRVRDLSKQAKLGVARFSRVFKQTFGLAPHAYLVQQRLQHARQLMLTTDEGLLDVALACGFVDQAHLCRVFRKSTGQSPAAWRRERREPPPAGASARCQSTQTC